MLPLEPSVVPGAPSGAHGWASPPGIGPQWTRVSERAWTTATAGWDPPPLVWELRLAGWLEPHGSSRCPGSTSGQKVTDPWLGWGGVSHTPAPYPRPRGPALHALAASAAGAFGVVGLGGERRTWSGVAGGRHGCTPFPLQVSIRSLPVLTSPTNFPNEERSLPALAPTRASSHLIRGGRWEGGWVSTNKIQNRLHRTNQLFLGLDK